MKKIFTTTLSMVLGLSFAANATTYVPETINPESGSTLSSVPEEVEISWGNTTLALNPDAEGYEDWDGYGDPQINLPVYVNGEVWMMEEFGGAEPVNCAITVNEENNLVVNLWTASYYFLETYGSGTLSFVIPEGALVIGSNDTNSKVTIEYEIISNYMSSSAVCDFVDGTLFVCWAEEISIIEGNTVTANIFTPTDFFTPIQVELSGPTTWIPNAVEGGNYGYNDNALMVNLSSIIEECGEGEYSITIPEGVVQNQEGKVNNNIWAGFTVGTPAVVVGYTDLVLTGEAITVTWKDYEISVNPENEANIILYNTIDYEQEFYPQVGDGVSINNDNVIIDLEKYELTDGGSYYFMIPEGYFNLSDGEETYVNDYVELPFTYEASDIKKLEINLGEKVVYNLNGMKVDGNNIPAGINIINGKKVLIRK